MKKTKIARLGIVALFAVLAAIPAASAHATVYFVPQDSSVPEGYCNTTYVEIWANATDPHFLHHGQFAINYDQSCCNITDLQWGSFIYEEMSSWNADPDCYGYGMDMIWFSFFSNIQTDTMICNLTVHCNSTDYCKTGLDFTCGRRGCILCPILLTQRDGFSLYPDNGTLVNGTFECGEALPPQTFEKEFVEGWNLISLPLTNETNMTVANIIDKSLGGKYDALYKYNASTDDFVSLSSSDTMENGVGYFIHMTAVGTWSYSGEPYENIEVGLSKGLNCVGWTNTSASLPDALSSIGGKYTYVARWNATSQSYEVYEPHAPDVFNDFWTMDRGEGYWIAAKEDCTLKYPYP